MSGGGSLPGCEWFDVAELWREKTGLPWVAAVWACRPEAVRDAGELIADLNESRVHGCGHVEELVREWVPRIGLPEGGDSDVPDGEYSLLAG